MRRCHDGYNVITIIVVCPHSYCPSHARKAALLRQQAGRKKQPRDTPETLLSRLESHVAKATPAEHGRSEAKRARTHESVASRVLGEGRVGVYYFTAMHCGSSGHREPTRKSVITFVVKVEECFRSAVVAVSVNTVLS